MRIEYDRDTNTVKDILVNASGVPIPNPSIGSSVPANGYQDLIFTIDNQTNFDLEKPTITVGGVPSNTYEIIEKPDMIPRWGIGRIVLRWDGRALFDTPSHQIDNDKCGLGIFYTINRLIGKDGQHLVNDGAIPPPSLGGV